MTTELLYVTDNPFERARKTWKLLGFSNDRLGHIGTLAEIFMAYGDLDKRVCEVIKPAPEPSAAKR